jgi:flagellar basal-body rod protein FlgF
MGYGIIETADAMSRMIQKMEHVSSNLANAATTGYKAEHLFASGQAVLPSELEEGETLPPAMVAVDYTKGIAQRTGNNLDVMIENEGFFAVQTKNGTAYTRRGDFTLNRDGVLVTQTGDPVLGERGAMTVQGQSISISRDGDIKVDGSDIGRSENLGANGKWLFYVVIEPGKNG